MMIHICLILSFGIFACFTNIGTSAFIFIYGPRNFPHPYLPPEKSDAKEINDEYNSLIPFPPFFSFIKQRSPYRFFHFWDNEDSKEKTTTASLIAEKVQERENDSSNSMNNMDTNVTGAAESHLITHTSTISAKILSLYNKVTKLPGNDSKLHSEIPVRKYPLFPWSILKFERFHRRYPINFWKKRETGAAQAENNNTKVAVPLTAPNLNNTAGNLIDPQIKEAQNCTRRSIFSRYVLIWSVNWASVAMNLTAILVLSAIVTAAVVLCCPYCVKDQSTSQLIKTKPMSV